jgi:uncharacterized protein (DUF169 family)
MINYARIEHQITEALGLTRRPVAVAFLDGRPAGVEPFTGTLPSGCSFWSLAAEGRTFATSPADHYNCPIGSYTHNIPLPPAREPELAQTLSLMADIGYIRMEEVAGIPRVAATPATIVYAPLADTPIAPDVVVVSGPPGRLMLLHEAATRSGLATQPLFGRPTCMAIPAAMGNAVVSSMGCIGNRVYTGLPESEMYTTVAGGQIERVADQLATITSANAALTDYHTQRRASLTA